MVGAEFAVEHPPAAEGAGHHTGNGALEFAAPVAFRRHAVDGLAGFFAFGVDALHGFLGWVHEGFLDRNLLFGPFHLEDFHGGLSGQRPGGGLYDQILVGVDGHGEQGFGDAVPAVRHRGRGNVFAQPREGELGQLLVNDDADFDGGTLFGFLRGMDGQRCGQRAAAQKQRQAHGQQRDPALTGYHGTLQLRGRRLRGYPLRRRGF